MNDTIRESTPMITPDSLRKINQVNQAFYKTHTEKNFGRCDVYGSQYSGTVENFGFEMLLEARKIRMEKPSLKGVFKINHCQYYFDIQYSNMIETYEQQGMLEAVLRKDVFLSDKEYRIKFTNCEDIYIPRSESWGALNEQSKSKVFKDKFIHTKKAPKLLIKDISSGITDEIDLRLEVDEGSETDYYFYNEFATEKFIDTYVGGELITKPITDADADLPFIWICVDIFKSLPHVDFGEYNEYVVNKPILTIGVDGHNVSHIYPLVYGFGSLPNQPSTGKWYLKAFSNLDGFIPEGSNNHVSKLSSIEYMFRPDDGNGDKIYPISFMEEYIKISLSDKVKWDIVRDHINEPYHAEICMDVFEENGSPDIKTVLTEAFDIGFSDDYLFKPYEGLCEDAVSGIHVDILSDYSENSVPKKNGTIHSLGEFDGLPSYFKSFRNRTIHRSHTELYTIRDRLNRETQIPTDKQTAALLLDSAMPQDELKNLVDNQEPAIVYKYDPEKYLYTTDPDKVISNKNVVTEVTFNDENTFGNCNIPAHSKKPKFIYHGNRTFSLSSVEFDPEIEIARVYYVNNDPISYVNNATLPSNEKKSPLALARICDIPTAYEQLMHIDNLAATYLFDQRYVRMGASFNNDDMTLLRNDRGMKVVMTPGKIGNQWVYDSEWTLPTKQQLVDAGYCKTININNSEIPITISNFKVLAGGTGYSVGDTFYVLVGGKAYDGIIRNTIMGGHVPENNPSAIELTVSEDSRVSIYNVDGTNTTLKTVTVSSELGTGLQIELVISKSDIDSHTPTITETTHQDDLIAFARDLYGNIFLYSLNSDWEWDKVCQIEGSEVRNNPYDSNTTQGIRTFAYAFNKYLFGSRDYADEKIFFNPKSYIRETSITDYEDAKGHKGDATTSDLSEYIVGRNMPDTFYRLICENNSDNGHFKLETFELKSLDGYKTTLPRFNTNNTIEHYNHSNRLILSSSESLNKIQPSMFVYSPSHNTRIDDYRIMTDMVVTTSSHITSYNDYGSNIMNSSGILEHNVYYYPEYEFSDSYNKAKEDLRSLHRSDLITYIRDVFGKDSEPLKLEDGGYSYSYDDLIEYVMARYPSDGPYIKDGLKVHGYAGDQAVDPISGEVRGKPVTGGVVSLTAEIIDANVTVDGKKEQSDLVNIFIIDDVSFKGFSENFRVHDENGVDITSTAVIIWQSDKYVFKNDQWLQLAKSVVEKYYNPNDKMFYYDQQYSNIITPDVDIVYCDITTGQYYKWNGNNYILITI